MLKTEHTQTLFICLTRSLRMGMRLRELSSVTPWSNPPGGFLLFLRLLPRNLDARGPAFQAGGSSGWEQLSSVRVSATAWLPPLCANTRPRGEGGERAISHGVVELPDDYEVVSGLQETAQSRGAQEHLRVTGMIQTPD